MNALTVADLSIVAGDEPRMMDLRLAEALGFAHPRRIRALIRRHLAALKRFGEVRTTAVQTSALGGRPSKASWLNRKQSLYICTKSETERATEITIQIVEVFDEHLTAQAAVPAIAVKAHHRAAPRRAAPSLSQAGRGCMAVEGQGLVWFDRRYLPRPGDTVLAINHDGQPVVAPVADRHDAAFTRDRVWIERFPRPMRTWEHMVWVGIVTTPAGRLIRSAMAKSVNDPFTSHG